MNECTFGEAVLDTLWKKTERDCQENSIDITILADGKVLDFMSSEDIQIVVGGTVGHAVEQVKRISDSEKRLVQITLTEKKQFLFLQTGYCRVGDEPAEENIPSGVIRCVEKLGGAVTTRMDQHWMVTNVLIPIP